MNTAQKKSKLATNCGVSLVEVLVSLMLTGILATAAFEFYANAHSTTESQHDVSELQVACRNTLLELKKNVRMAGYKISGHTALEIRGNDTLAIYLNETQAVDTILYYPEEFEEDEYEQMSGLPDTLKVCRLMCKQNSGAPVTVSDYITNISYNQIDASNLEISVTAITSKRDFDWPRNSGYRLLTLSELVCARNAG